MAADPRRVKELFVAALDLSELGCRQAFLERECGADAELRQRLEVLLQAHDAPARALDPPPAAAGQAEGTGSEDGSAPPLPEEQVGAVLADRYKLLEQIGEGGMGTVWVAEQTQPVRRKVALKLIKAGMDSKQVLSRFEMERQTLALMDHPNIAKVLDGGTTKRGRPFFVMEYVKGVPFTKYCDDARLSIRERLELFVPACQAVQHAHQKGIIHRDLKPSNILVCLYDGVPVPKVIDFGLAKAMHHSLTEHTLYTAHGLLLGTPQYMSPEQAEFNNLDVDTRTDIYSLGVILYELLTGTTPLEKQRLKKASWPDMVRLIKEEEPPRPSTRLSGSGPLPSVAAQRRLEPVKLTRLVRGELDWIVMKCLEKERSRRYETANGLARDIERYLADEPVQACPPSSAYRLRKFVRKHRAGLGLAAGLAALLLVGAVVSGWQAVRATRAEAAALTSLDETETARDAEGKQRRAAEAAERKARAAAAAEKRATEAAQARQAETQAVLEFVENRVLAAARPEGEEGGLGRDVKLRQAIDAALPHVAHSFRDQPLIEARLRTTLGKSFSFLGENKMAAEQFQAARILYSQHLGPDHPDTLRSMTGLALVYNNLSRFTEARKLFEETLALQKDKLRPDHPDTLRTMNGLAWTYRSLGQFADALKLQQETLSFQKASLGPYHADTLRSRTRVATMYTDLSRHADALTLHEETLSLCKAKLGPDHTETLRSMHNLGNGYELLGRDADALKLRQETLALCKAKFGPDHLRTLGSMGNLANSYANLGRSAEAIKLCQETLERMQAKLGSDHVSTLIAMSNLGLWLAGAPDVKLRDPARALALVKRTIDLAPKKSKIPWLSEQYGIVRYRNGDWKGAVATLNEAIARGTPDDPASAASAYFLAMAHWHLGEKDQARQWYAKAVRWRKPNKEMTELKRYHAEAAKLLGVAKKE
jgi:serine/threonine protein kinase/tetratricopeptide (TPR) repeat protein